MSVSPATSKLVGLITKARDTLRQLYRGSKELYAQVQEANQYRKLLSQGKSLDRNQFLLIKSVSDDMRRLAPFIVVVLVLPEIIPFLILRGWDIIPSTCLLPDQKLSTLKTLTNTRIAAANQILNHVRVLGTDQKGITDKGIIASTIAISTSNLCTPHAPKTAIKIIRFFLSVALLGIQFTHCVAFKKAFCVFGRR